MNASEPFSFDVFLSHSAKDKDIVRELAMLLRADGLKVWFDEWTVNVNNVRSPARRHFQRAQQILEGLKRSRVLVLCMSANAFGSDWTALEAGTFRFRDPSDKERRFIPLRLDDAPIPGSLAQFLYIDWLSGEREQEYARLRNACCSPSHATVTEAPPPSERILMLGTQLAYKGKIYALAFNTQGSRVLTGADDSNVRLWSSASGHCLRVFKGHHYAVWSVAWSADQRYALSGDCGGGLRLWEVDTGKCIHVLGGHTGKVWSVQWSVDQRYVLSGAWDRTMRLWDANTGLCLRVFQGHTDEVRCVAWSADGRQVISGAEDRTVRVWDVESGRCLRVFEGHTIVVMQVAISCDGRKRPTDPPVIFA